MIIELSGKRPRAQNIKNPTLNSSNRRLIGTLNHGVQSIAILITDINESHLNFNCVSEFKCFTIQNNNALSEVRSRLNQSLTESRLTSRQSKLLESIECAVISKLK